MIKTSAVTNDVFRGVFEVKFDADERRWQASIDCGIFGCGVMGDTPQEAVRKFGLLLETEAPLPTSLQLKRFQNRRDTPATNQK